MFKKITSCLLALIVMMSTLSFSISKHYCSNILVDIAVLQPAKTCGMHTSDHDKENSNSNEKSCCDDELQLIEGQDELKLSFADFSLDIPLEMAVFNLIYSFPESYTFKTDKAFNIYQPPEYTCDFQILHRVFLI